MGRRHAEIQFIRDANGLDGQWHIKNYTKPISNTGTYVNMKSVKGNMDLAHLEHLDSGGAEDSEDDDGGLLLGQNRKKKKNTTVAEWLKQDKELTGIVPLEDGDVLCFGVLNEGANNDVAMTQRCLHSFTYMFQIL